MKTDFFNKFLTFLNQLEQQKINYQIHHHRDEAVMITVSLVGERWEIEFLDNGDIEVEKFISNGEIEGEEALKEICEREKLDNSLIEQISLLG
ncbi:hypothetical protein [Crocosphaera chwakensis]|uniref:Uncharacterized protein n=1 Tax=Crocosphaera chwakensis CCY0110 TaxID=391612 RepID=A3IYV8_9CHRO|nr:hypothetical protein [Crocosphaera chwakensis]EAZ88333.1 hypothetical protein CY0110_20920 [Crocosphaera chwakensis CCY0110]